ncbi:MAG: cation:proton antiporter [Mariprofundaceae bacterium]|nr:cation:proton antiporter [Mariprofundaceae bacterium]
MPLSETVFVTVCLLAVAVLAAAICRRVPIPFTALLVVLGILLGWLDQEWLLLEPLQAFHLSPELVLFVFLPALIFESGFNLDDRQLLKDIVPIFTLAVPALLLSTSLIGLGLWWLLDMSPVYALLFGALISATDPIAVIALFKELGAPLRLNVLVEGESLLNDATALVVFKVLLGVAVIGTMQWQDVGTATGEFGRVFFGGALVGLVIGMLLSEAMRFMQSHSAVFTLTIVMAYAGFIVSEHLLHMSGVMTVVVAAICLGVWGRSRMSQEVAETARDIWEFIAYICNALLFLLVGLSVEPGLLVQHGGAITVAILLVLLVRAVTVHSMVPLVVRWFRLPAIGYPERQIMWWGGLKGSLAIAMALSIPADVPSRDMLLAMTVGVVVFTLLVNASTIRPFMKMLGMDRLDLHEEAELNSGLRRAEQGAIDVLTGFRKVGVLSKGAYHNITDDIHHLLKASRIKIEQEENERNAYLSLLHTQLETLDMIYEAGVIPQYTRIDIRQQIQSERDQLCSGASLQAIAEAADQRSMLGRAEQYLLGKLRELDWLSHLLMRYQYMRLSQHFRRDVARLMMAESSINALQRDESMSGKIREMLLEHLQDRRRKLEESLIGFKRDMPEFYRRYSYRIASQAAWSGAMAEAELLFNNGQMGGKSHARLSRLLRAKFDSLPPVSSSIPEISTHEIISMVPLFADLSEEVVNELVARAVTVTFLPGDRVIGQGEKGDALYIVMHGLLRVHSTESDEDIALLEDGDFFGEMALLGEQVRLVNVTAVHACELLRIRRGDVLELAERFPQISQQLHDVEQQRRNAES